MLVKYLFQGGKQFYALSVAELLKLVMQWRWLIILSYPNHGMSENHPGKSGIVDLAYGTHNYHCALQKDAVYPVQLHNVNIFFDNLSNVMARNLSFADGTRIFKLDETSNTTESVHFKGLTRREERVILVTTCCIVNATAQYLLPAMPFPRVFFKKHMVNGAPSGTLGLANQSGWMNADLFIDVINHFIQHSHSSMKTPSLLIDNHKSHLSAKVLSLAKENGVAILTLPLHSTSKLQPLDVGVYTISHSNMQRGFMDDAISWKTPYNI